MTLSYNEVTKTLSRVFRKLTLEITKPFICYNSLMNIEYTAFSCSPIQPVAYLSYPCLFVCLSAALPTLVIRSV